ncbi:MAG: energy-coupling factor transporter transmembrane protein EcfT [Thermodesulfobacteriota bacterium]|nr:energy-coupling factor transporter transmembrane protein EcfT [Thermodesulfobacteriota bacterium]
MKITLGQYIPRESPVHALDSRVKLFVMGLGIAAAFQLDTPVGMISFALMCLSITLISRIPLARMISGLSPFIWLFAFTALLHVFMTPGKEISWLPYATIEGVESGLKVGSQLIFAIWLSTLMTLTTSPLDMVWAMEWYMKPLGFVGVRVDEIALLIMLAIRFIPLLFEETDRIIKAQKARGVDLESGGIISRVKALVPILVPLLHGVFRRADDLAVALTLRGYKPGIKRGHLKTSHIKTSDCLIFLVISSVMSGLMFL